VTRLVDRPLRPEELIEQVRGDADGAVALFLGTVRDHNQGRRVTGLEYHAYAEMADAQMRRIEEQALERFDVSRVRVMHRTGRLEIGEASVAVAVGAPHRAAAMEACRWVIDTLKTEVPIWKKEFFEGGAAWVEPGADETAGAD